MIVGGELSNSAAACSVGQDDVWIVHPIPGYVVKFKEVENSDSRPALMKEKCKLFLNICHCAELPAPTEDLSEDEVARILDSSDPSRYRIPLSVGDVEVVLDRKGEDSVKIDVIVNSTFYLTRLETSEFFRQLLLLVVSEAVEKKHDIKLSLMGAIKLKNRKSVGDLSTQRIRKKSQEAFIREIESEHPDQQFLEHQNVPKNCLLLLRDGKSLEVNLKLSNVEPPVTNTERLIIRMNDDHLLIILDRKQSILDIYFPVKVDYGKAAAKLLVDERVLQIVIPVIW